MENQAIAILNIPPLMRKPSEVAVLMDFTQHLSFFKNITSKTGSNSLHKACCQRMTLATYDSDSRIVEYGDVGYSFYILLSGTAQISVPSSNKDFSVVKHLRPGDSFGEQALMTGKPRAATVTATSSTKLAVLSKESYEVLIASITEQEIREKTEFLQGLPQFQGRSRLALVKLSYYFDLVQYKRKQVLYSMGSPVDYVYFVKSGEFLVSESVLVDTKTVVQKNSHTYKTLYTSNSLLNLKNCRQVNILSHQKIAYKGKNELVGAQEVLEGKTQRDFTCECVSETAQVYCIKASEFLTRVSLREPLRPVEKRPSSLQQANPKRILCKSNTRRIGQSVTELPKYLTTPQLPQLSKSPSLLPQATTPAALFKKKPSKNHTSRALSHCNNLFSARQGLDGGRLQRKVVDSARM